MKTHASSSLVKQAIPSEVIDYIETRTKLSELETKRRQLEPSVIDYGMSQINGKESFVFFKGKSGQLSISFRPKPPKPEEYPELETLDELIDIEQEKAILENKAAVEEIKDRIAKMQEVLNFLTQTDLGRSLIQEREELSASLTAKVPILTFKSSASSSALLRARSGSL